MFIIRSDKLSSLHSVESDDLPVGAGHVTFTVADGHDGGRVTRPDHLHQLPTDCVPHAYTLI